MSDLKDWTIDAAERENGLEVGVDSIGADQPLVKLRLNLTAAEKQVESLTAEIRKRDEALRHLAGRFRLHAEYVDSLLSPAAQGFCYCEIGAGGKPCISREHCDKFSATTKQTDEDKQNAD